VTLDQMQAPASMSPRYFGSANKLSDGKAGQCRGLPRLAKRRLPRAVFDYIDGGAGDERGLARNRDRLSQHPVRPQGAGRRLRARHSVPFFDTRLPMPFVVGPTGLNGAARPGGDAMLARAAAKAGIPFVLSTAATTSIEEIAKACDGEWWFQLYVMERDFAAELCRRAMDAGCRTLVLTVDCQIGGRRERDTRNGFVVPFRMTPRFFATARCIRVWALSQLRQRACRNSAISRSTRRRRGLAGRAHAAQARHLIRLGGSGAAAAGLAAPPDRQGHHAGRRCARRCYELGIDGVVISNHGGRQIEDVPAPSTSCRRSRCPRGAC
jgi:(S)-mandelate dehydrogenase